MDKTDMRGRTTPALDHPGNLAGPAADDGTVASTEDIVMSPAYLVRSGPVSPAGAATGPSGRMPEADAAADGEWPAQSGGRGFRPRKEPISIRVDADVLTWLRHRATHYQTEINTILRNTMNSEAADGPGGPSPRG